jgi:hypothetical protein
MARSESKDDDDYASVAAMADRLKLKGRDRSKYIHDHMTGFGYKMVPSYVKDDDDDSDSSRFFGSRSRSSSRSRRSGDDDDDSYPF